MANVWFSSDPHLGHEKMMIFTRPDGVTPLRSFSSAEEHDEYIIDRHNSVVKPQDKWYCMGDVAMKHKLHLHKIARFNGHKRLILGNHDEAGIKEYIKYFDEVYSVRVLDQIIFTHIPVHPESLSRWTANVHGHIHAQESPKGIYQGIKGPIQQRYLCVSMEQLDDYTPISLEQIKKKLY